MNQHKGFVFAAVLAFLCCLSPAVRAQSGTTYQNGRRLTCASDDGRRHLCPANTSQGVRMVNQRSGSPCIQGSTWGFNRHGVWVDRGCRADFFLGVWGPYPAPGPGPGPMPGPRPEAVITCSSNNGGRNWCPANTRGGVRLVRQRSGSPCIEGSTWGFNHHGVWVDRGCRADFALGY